MKRTANWMIIGAMASVVAANAAKAQQNTPDSLFAYREFARLGHMYRHPSVRLNVHLARTANPVTGSADTLQADMDLYYGKSDFYMSAEGLEEIRNDSVVVIVNNPTRRIMVYPNNHQAAPGIEKAISMFTPDSSLKALSNRYSSMLEGAGNGKKQITLTSRELVYGTAMPKEIVRIVYRESGYELVTFRQTKTSLVPLDAGVYRHLEHEPAYRGKLVSSTTAKGKLFFLAKEQTITCSFDKIDYEWKHPPVTERDRVEKTADGNYRPVKGFEDYILSNPF